MGRKSKAQLEAEAEAKRMVEASMSEGIQTFPSASSDAIFASDDVEMPSLADAIADMKEAEQMKKEEGIDTIGGTIVSEFADDPRIDSRQAPRRAPTNNNTSLRGMALSPEQKEMLLESEMKRILDKKREEELLNGVIPCTIDYPYDRDGFTVMHAFISRDARLVQSAWDYYKNNCDNPTVKDFVSRLHKICGREKVYQRIVHLHLV